MSPSILSVWCLNGVVIELTVVNFIGMIYDRIITTLYMTKSDLFKLMLNTLQLYLLLDNCANCSAIMKCTNM